MFNYLKKYNLIDDECIIIHRGTRDNENINVMRCVKNNLIFLDKIIKNDYENMSLQYWNNDNITGARETTYIDDHRRSLLVDKIIQDNKISNETLHILDFGCGNGGFLHLLNDEIIKYGIDINKDVNELLKNEKIIVYNSISQIPNNIFFNYITMFHVLEHIENPVDLLIDIKTKLLKGSLFIIEVPHANDILFNEYDNNAFKKSTFWSQHLVLYTKETLTSLLKLAGFKNITIKYCQRYNIFNHLYWLSNNKSGGQNVFKFENSNALISEYDNFLIKNEKTDTIIAFIQT